MVDDDVEVGREVNFNAISSEYGGDLLEKKEDKKDNNDKKDVKEKIKSEEEQPQVAEEEEVQEIEGLNNSDEKVDDVEKDGEEKESEEEQPQVADEEDSKQPTIVTMVVAEVAKTDIVFFNHEEAAGKAYQASADQIIIVSIEEQTLEVTKTEDEASQVIDVYIKALIQYFDTQHRARPDKERIIL
ncbi:hypothetical protein GIB67_021220, partial [Kingdonia uniflora]